MPIEAIARRLFALAGLSQTEVAGVGQLATALLGANSLDYAEQEEIAVLHERPWRIHVRLDASDQEITMGVSLGIAMWWLRTRHEDSVSAESLALCIAVPLAALREATWRLGHDANALAEEFVVTRAVIEHRLRSVPAVTHRSGVRTRYGFAS